MCHLADATRAMPTAQQVLRGSQAFPARDPRLVKTNTDRGGGVLYLTQADELACTIEFEPQTMPPSPAMLSIALRTLLSHKRLAEQGSPDASHDKELMAFYNCGQVSGASQPHQHMQFAELGGEYDASADDRGASVPAEALLDSIPRDGKEEGEWACTGLWERGGQKASSIDTVRLGTEHVHALPLPYQHFVVLISRAPTSNDEELNTYLGMKLMSLLDALFQARIAAAVNDQGNASAASSSTPQTKQSPSWNLLMTTRAMHLIPRQREEFDGLQKNSGTSGISAMVDEDGMELVGALSINSLGFAGHLLVKSDQELDALQRYPGGIVDVLRHTAIAPVADVTTSLHHEG